MTIRLWSLLLSAVAAIYLAAGICYLMGHALIKLGV